MKWYEMVFSPTGGTRKVTSLLTNALEGEMVSVDLTDSRVDFRAVALTQDDVAVISVPVLWRPRACRRRSENRFDERTWSPCYPGLCVWKPGV